MSWREEIWREVLCWCPEQRLSSKWLQWLLLRTAESGADPEKSLRIVLVLLVFPKIWIVLSLSDPQNQSTKINFKSTKYSFRFQQLAYSSYLPHTPPPITNGEMAHSYTQKLGCETWKNAKYASLINIIFFYSFSLIFLLAQSVSWNIF